MNYEDLVGDFARRTKANLALVESHATLSGGQAAFEVTQLVNSMLGLLVFPRERWFDRVPRTPLVELADAGWPVITVLGAVPGNDLKGLARYMRNAIAHCNIEFLPDGSGQIAGIRIWNVPPGKTDPDWKADLTVEQLRFIAFEFIEMLAKHP